MDDAGCGEGFVDEDEEEEEEEEGWKGALAVGCEEEVFIITGRGDEKLDDEGVDEAVAGAVDVVATGCLGVRLFNGRLEGFAAVGGPS